MNDRLRTAGAPADGAGTGNWMLASGVRAAALLLATALVAAVPASAQLLSRSTLLRGDSTASHYFGDDVAASGDLVAVGTASNRSVYVYQRTASGWTREARFEASFPNTHSSTVELDGNTLIVANQVYVRTAPGTWTLQFTLPTDLGPFAISGDTIVAGQPNDGHDGSFPSADGAVHVFVRSGGTWTLQAKLTPDAPRNEAMGSHVAIDGDTIVAGSSSFVGPDVGTYVFVRNGSSWSQQARLTPPEGMDDGWAASIRGDWIALGDPRRNFVHLYRRNGGNWNFVQTVGAWDSDRSYFGSEVALLDGMLAVMAERVRTYPSYQATLACYLFSLTDGGWVQAQRMDRPGNAIWGSLAASGRTVVLGDGSDSEAAYYAGSANIYDTPAAASPGSGWQSLDIGAVGQPGGSDASGTTISVRGSGADIWGTADAFHYRTETMTGDGAVVVRVDSLTNTDGFAKAGIMFREDVSPSARNAMILATPSRNISFQYRAERSGTSQYTLGAYGVPNAWLMLARTGNVFSGYRSNDGENWIPVGSATIAMPATIHVGLAVTSHNNAALATGVFSELERVGMEEPPPPPPPPPPSGGWTGSDIGAVGLAGSSGESGGTFTVSASGADIWDSADSFRYVYRAWSGDGEIVARVASMTVAPETHTWSKAGVMFRASLAPGSPHVSALVTPRSAGTALQLRSTSGGGSAMTAQAWGASAPRWVRLVRAGNNFTAYHSTNGTTWTLLGSQSVAMGASVYVGLAVTSHNNARLETATFDNVTVTASGAPPPSLAPPSGLAQVNTGSTTSNTLSWTDNSADETGFQIERAPGGSSTFAQVGSVGASVTTYTDPGLAAGTSYNYRVRAVRGAEASGYSNVVTATTMNETAPWQHARIGAAVSGSASFEATRVQLTSASSDIWGTADAFEYGYRIWSGDGEIITRVEGPTNTHGWAKAGIMFRATLGAGSPHAFVFLTPGVGVAFQYRETANGQSGQVAHVWGPASPWWLRLVRSGNTFTAYASANGTTWSLLGSRTIAMPAQIHVGFALTSHNNSATATATFGSIQGQ